MMHVLIIGGYGTFGFRIAQLLSGESGLTVTLAGRNLEKARSACERLTGAASFRALCVDRQGDLQAQISTVPDIIIDASGPFQSYEGVGCHNVVEYALSAPCHYLDLSDDEDFTANIYAFNERAKAKGVTILSGLSTYPVITAAAAKHMNGDQECVTDIIAGIAPSPKSALGRSVIGAIASYAGKPVNVLSGGHVKTKHGLTLTRRHTVSPPGYDPLENRLFSLVQAPDSRVLSRYFPQLETLSCYAGPRPEVLHRGLIALAWAVRLRLLPGLRKLTGLFHFVQNKLASGVHRGGMFVCIKGRADDGARFDRSWNLIAEGDEGPFIPAMPCAIMVRKWLLGLPVPSGARSAVTDISMGDLDAEFAKWNIVHGVCENRETFVPLYEELLGEAYERLPQTIQSLHDVKTQKIFRGECRIERGRNPLAQAVANIFRFPKARAARPVKVVLTRSGHKEVWERFFDGKRMVSTQEVGRGRREKLITERFGPISVNLAVILKDRRLHLKTKNWSFLGLPLPLTFAPGGDIYEYEAQDKFYFHVDICAPLLGRLVKYEGWLLPDKL